MNYKRVVIWLYLFASLSILMSFASPIWSATTETLSQRSATADYYVIGKVVSGDPTVLGGTGYLSLSELSSPQRLALSLFLVMAIVAVIILIYEIIVLDRKNKSLSNQRVDAFVLVPLALSLITPIIFIYQWTSALNSEGNVHYDYWGKVVIVNGFLPEGVTYGPNIGWYLLFLAAVLILLGIMVTWYSNRTPRIKPERNEDNVRSVVEKPVSGQTVAFGVPVGEKKGTTPILLCGSCKREIPIDSRLCPYCGVEIRR